MASADKGSGSPGADDGDLSGTDSDDPMVDPMVDPMDDSKFDQGEGLDEVDEWGEESFPASDPPASWSGPPDT
jgi:hypothetical protein